MPACADSRPLLHRCGIYCTDPTPKSVDSVSAAPAAELVHSPGLVREQLRKVVKEIWQPSHPNCPTASGGPTSALRAEALVAHMDHLQNNERHCVDRTPIGKQTEPESGGSYFARNWTQSSNASLRCISRTMLQVGPCCK